MEQNGARTPQRAQFLSKRRVEFPDIKGKVEDNEGSICYEVLQVSNGNALVWSVLGHPCMPKTASGGFGWVEDMGGRNSGSLDSALLRRRIESRLRSQLPTARVTQTVA